jgi:hypothetical protein
MGEFRATAEKTGLPNGEPSVPSHFRSHEGFTVVSMRSEQICVPWSCQAWQLSKATTLFLLFLKDPKAGLHGKLGDSVVPRPCASGLLGKPNKFRSPTKNKLNLVLHQ